MTREEALNECISRDKAIVQLNHLKSDWDDDWNVAICRCIETIKIMKPVSPMPKWISVTEKLPEVGQRVIATIESIDGNYVRETIYDKHGFLCGNGIAWMPLPEPYKSEIPTGSEGSEKND